MAKIKTVNGVLTKEDTSITDVVIDGGLGIVKAFSKDDTYYSGATVATAQGVGIVAGLFLAAKFPQVNVFA